MDYVFIWFTALANFMGGANIVYIYEHPEFGYWRIPVLFVSVMFITCMSAFGARAAKS
jgi:hypothetical protein